LTATFCSLRPHSGGSSARSITAAGETDCLGQEDYPINPRRIYKYGKREGSKISMEFIMTRREIIVAGIGYSRRVMRSEVKKSLDFVNSAPEIDSTLGRRDLPNHLSCVHDHTCA
jgi:hypothetical protein